MWKFNRVMSEYTSAEVETATGVSQDLQRNWRRRGLIAQRPDRKRARYSTYEVMVLAAMKQFSDAGISVRGTQSLSHMMGFEATKAIEALPDAISFDGSSESSAAVAEKAWRSDTPHPSNRYIYVPMPEQMKPGGSTEFRGRNDLSDIQDLIDIGGSTYGLIFDAAALAQKVAKNLSFPVATFTAERDGSNQ